MSCRAACAALLMVPMVAVPASLNWQVSAPFSYDHGRQTALPAGFGAGEFTLEIWVQPDSSFPIGPTASGSGQLLNWATADIVPYSSFDWWFAGNFLLDGINNANPSLGSFALQFYAGGRVRWLFGDGANVVGGLWSVGAYPGATTSSLLDGQWHHITLVRRWLGTTQSRLELWVDGTLVDFETSPARTNMQAFWNDWSAFPPQEAGWFWGAEKQAAIGTLDQHEDYKGLMGELRFWSRAKTDQEIAANFAAPISGNEVGLVGWYRFAEAGGNSACSTVGPSSCMTLFNTQQSSWAALGPPSVPATGDIPLPAWALGALAVVIATRAGLATTRA